MNRRSSVITEYYRILFHRTLPVLPRLLLVLFGTILLLFGLPGILSGQNSDTLLPRINIVIVSDPGDLTISLAAGMISQMESVSSICTFTYLDEEAAETSLRSGDAAAVIYLPDGIYEDIDSGVNTPIRVQIRKDSSLGFLLFRDLVDTGLSMLQTGEAAVYSLYDASLIHEMVLPVQDLMDDLAADYLSLALSRNRIWTSSFLSPYGDILAGDFFLITGILAIILLLAGPCFVLLHRDSDCILGQNLRRIGVTPLHQSLARILPMGLTIFAFLLLILGGLTAVYGSDLLNSIQGDLFSLPISSLSPGGLLLLLPLAFSLACCIHAIQALAQSASGTMVYLLAAALLLVLGGGLFPAAYLPGTLQKISGFLPVIPWQNYLIGIFQGSIPGTTILQVLVSGLLSLTAGVMGVMLHER